jgi:1,4-dihydroxy-2-naphthoate octaprenyltransferase
VHGTALLGTAFAIVAIVAGLVLAHRRGHLIAAAVAVLLLLAAAWVLAKVAYDRDYRDADGFVDCWPSCSPVQHAVGVSLFVAPLVAVLVACITIAGLAIRRARKRTA